MTRKPTYKELEQRIKNLEKRFPQVGKPFDSQRILSDLMDNSGSLIVLKDRGGRYFFVNRKWQDITGISRDLVMGKTDDEVFEPETSRQFMGNDRQVMDTGQTIEVEEHLSTPSGSRWFISVKLPLFDEKGSVSGLCGIITEITERKRMEEALKANEEKYLSLFNNTQIALFKSTLDGRLVEINRRYAEMAGYPTVESCMAEFDVLKAWTNPEARRDMISVIREKGVVRNFETQLQRMDGTRFWILISATYCPESETIEGSAVDISDRKTIEEALKRSEAMQKKMVSHIGDVIAIIDEKGVNTYKSPNLEKLFGWKPEELIGQNSFKTVHPDDREIALSFFRNLMKEPGSVGSFECRYQCKDGRYRWIEFTGSNLLHDPDIRGILGNYHDIMDRKQAEQTLRESEARFKALHNASFGGIAIHDKGIILDCNQGLADMSGYSTDELIGMNGLLLIADESRDMVMANIVSGSEKPYEAVALHKNGTKYTIRIEARNVPYKGRIVRSTEFRDLTESKRAEAERKKLEEQLTQAQKMESVGRLAGGVAHDYNNMLSVIIGYTELAMNDVPSATPLYKFLREIHRAAERSTEITRQLLAFARKQTIAPKVLDMNEVVESMFKMLRRLIGEDIDIAWLPESRLWPIKIDPSQIEQILANLCVNARDAILGVGKVTIETHKVTLDKSYAADHGEAFAGDYVLLAVSDDGCGMDKETLANIFEPFFTTKGINEGTGLGLATVYGIVKQNNGFINVYSEPDKGTTFRIYLPRHDGDIEKTISQAVSTFPESRGEIILLVEDESSIRIMSQMMLEKMGYQVISAGTPHEAILLAREHRDRIDLLISDVVMPGMNGRDMADQLKHLYPAMKTLFMSGYTANIIAHRGVLEEEVQFIQKPFSMIDLGHKVREVLESAG